MKCHLNKALMLHGKHKYSLQAVQIITIYILVSFLARIRNTNKQDPLGGIYFL